MEHITQNIEQKGFTIIELIISIFIMSIAVVGIYSAFSIMSILTSNISDRLVGTYLAQEGQELIRNKRDNNWLALGRASWDNGLSSCQTETGCIADYAGLIRPWANDYLNKDEAGFYNYNAGQKTKFKRKILIQKSFVPDFIKVLVQVSWDEKANLLNPVGSNAGVCNSSNCIELESTLYNWFDR